MFAAKRKLSRDTNSNTNKLDSFRIGQLNSSLCDELEDRHIGISGLVSGKPSISKLERFVTFTSAVHESKKAAAKNSILESRVNSSLMDHDSNNKLRQKLTGVNVSPALEIISRKSQKLLNAIGREKSISKLVKVSQTLKNNSTASSGLFEAQKVAQSSGQVQVCKNRGLGSRVINTIKECKCGFLLSSIHQAWARIVFMHQFEF
jgi:hypothetical protein